MQTQQITAASLNLSLVAIVVTYHPKLEILQRLVATISQQVLRVIIVDNGSLDLHLDDASGFPNAELIKLGDNLGIAAAQNVGIMRARQLGASFVVLFDQDSNPGTDLLPTLYAEIQTLLNRNVRVACVGPRYFDARQNQPAPFVRIEGCRLRRIQCSEQSDVMPVDHLIASGSMIPTLQIGDFILVNKFTYGIRLPVLNQKVVELGSPQRGDVVVFRYPRDESVDYIKRVVALPGDEITYENKRLTINGQPLQYSGGEPYLDPENMRYAKRFTEAFPADLGGNRHEILNDPDRPATVFPTERFPGSEFCQYQQSGLTCKVPPGHYFAMGDNRDNSADSRYWGFVPDKNIVGKAFFVWLNLGNLGRIGGFE